MLIDTNIRVIVEKHFSGRWQTTWNSLSIPENPHSDHAVSPMRLITGQSWPLVDQPGSLCKIRNTCWGAVSWCVCGQGWPVQLLNERLRYYCDSVDSSLSVLSMGPTENGLLCIYILHESHFLWFVDEWRDWFRTGSVDNRMPLCWHVMVQVWWPFFI